jgi:hypothetical protein
MTPSAFGEWGLFVFLFLSLNRIMRRDNNVFGTHAVFRK